jgi:hypothetical protein
MRNPEDVRRRGDVGQVAIVLLTAAFTVPRPIGAQTTTFAVIGDFGSGVDFQARVAQMIDRWNPDFIVTTGDNSYFSDYESTVGATYGHYVESGRFFPAIGNHDLNYPDSYFSYFDLPGAKYYYDVVVNNVQLLIYDNNFYTGEEVSVTPVDQAEQDAWLNDTLADSPAEWKFLFAHHPRAVDSIRANHVPEEIMLSHGGDAYFFGHNHYYQRNVMPDSIPSFIVGHSGASLYPHLPGKDEPEAFYNDSYGALKVIVDGSSTTIESWSIAGGGMLVDRYSLPGPPPPDAPGDYNGDGLLTVWDIDLQALAPRGSNPFIAKFDENADGSVDITDREIWVHQHRQTYFGDANLDGVFNSGDLVSVFVAGEYEDRSIGKSTWSTGDWNGDGEFASSDLVLALADGGYEAASKAAAVPEPASVFLLSLALGMSSSLIVRGSRE